MAMMAVDKVQGRGRTLADVRAQVAEGVAVRAITKSEVIDGGHRITCSRLMI